MVPTRCLIVRLGECRVEEQALLLVSRHGQECIAPFASCAGVVVASTVVVVNSGEARFEHQRQHLRSVVKRRPVGEVVLCFQRCEIPFVRDDLLQFLFGEGRYHGLLGDAAAARWFWPFLPPWFITPQIIVIGGRRIPTAVVAPRDSCPPNPNYILAWCTKRINVKTENKRPLT